jgi:hypothetical protein
MLFMVLVCESKVITAALKIQAAQERTGQNRLNHI